jgi:hypothetical protein
MNNFRILICEDNSSDQRNIQLHLGTIKRSLPEINVSFKIATFEETYNELGNEYDLLILDLWDNISNSNAGENILMHNKGNGNIPTLVYTSTGDSSGFEFKSKKIEYPFLIDKLTKIHNSGHNLIEFIKGLIIVNGDVRYYNLYNSYDENLKLSIELIGLNSFNYILYNIREKYATNEICVHPMTSGLSGAILFKLEFNQSKYILKLSKEVSKLKEEHENGTQLYNQFPSHLINHIVYEEYYSFDQNVLGILIKNVDGSETLFDFLNNNEGDNKARIEKFFRDLYLEDNTLSGFFEIKRGPKVDWSATFEKIDENKVALAKKSFRELSPIILKYYNSFDFQDLSRLIISYDYGNLIRKNCLTEEYLTGLVLSHGDFHSKNILIQGGNRPVIIDTGSLGYQHWSLDYSRLIVHILINGIDSGSVEYFDLSEIPKNITFVDNILHESKIDLDGKNDNFIIAINWLVGNYKEIFGNVNKFELQLGLMKEFIQASYRFDTIPANKRALALIAAHKCMLAADQSISLVLAD